MRKEDTGTIDSKFVALVRDGYFDISKLEEIKQYIEYAIRKQKEIEESKTEEKVDSFFSTVKMVKEAQGISWPPLAVAKLPSDNGASG